MEGGIGNHGGGKLRHSNSKPQKQISPVKLIQSFN